MTVDPERLLGEADLGDAVSRLLAVVEPERVVPGWATVELDRAEVEVRGSPGGTGATRPGSPVPDDILGATCRFVRVRDDREIVLLEPATEGRLAAALARHGEGTVALYLVTDPAGVDRVRQAGFALSTVAAGPLGAQRLILGGPRDGPFLLLTGLDRHGSTSAS